MTAYVAIANSQIDPDSPGTTGLFTQLRDNPIAITEKAAGAPVLANSYVVEAMINAAAVTQSKLKTSTSGASTTAARALITFAGGQYGWWPQFGTNNFGQTTRHFYIFSLGHYPADTGLSFWDEDELGVGQLNRITMGQLSGADIALATQRFVQSSPPFQPYRKDDPVPLFMFATIDKPSGKVISTYVAPDPPWANNGPTVINPLGLVAGWNKKRAGINVGDLHSGKIKPNKFGALIENVADPTAAEVEELKQLLSSPIPQEVKNADMELIPHPFAGLSDNEVVVVVCPTDNKLCNALFNLHEMNEEVTQILSGGHLTIDNDPLDGFVTPSTVMAVSAKWKNTSPKKTTRGH